MVLSLVVQYAVGVNSVHTTILRELQRAASDGYFSLELDDPRHGRITRLGWLQGESQHRAVPLNGEVITHGDGWIFAEGYEADSTLGGYVTASVVLRHTDGELFVEGEPGPTRDALKRLVSHHEVLSRSRAAEREVHGDANVRWRHSDDQYLTMIETCIDTVAAEGTGSVRCLTNMATVTRPGGYDPVDVFLGLQTEHREPRAGLIVTSGRALVSASPETFIVCRDGLIATEPMKGTRPRGATVAEDEALRLELETSAKERAENEAVALGVLEELRMVSEPDTARVVRGCVVKPFARVHQMVSEIEATLRQGVTLGEVLDAVFPAASMTGVPKEAAVQQLATLEAGERGLYSGCYGWASADGADVQVAMAIRCAEIRGDVAFVGAGGGITAASKPSDELAEVKLKARAVLNALGAGYP